MRRNGTWRLQLNGVADGSEAICGLAAINPAQLVNYTALGKDPTSTPITVTSKDVRFIINASRAQAVFGTPFGNMPRNLPQDAITNTANFSVIKGVKLGERASFEFRMSMLNALNHQNFSSVDPFLEDAGIQQQGFGFGDPSLTNTTYPGTNGATRRITFGGTLRF